MEDENWAHFYDIAEWEPVKEKKKITLYRFTMKVGKHGDIHQANWTEVEWEEYNCNSPELHLLKTETKEVEIDD